MKHTAPLVGFVFTVASILATQAHAESYPDNSYVTRARVVDSTPIIETVYEQREICRYKYVTEKSNKRQQGAIGERLIGGAIGGAAGSAFGKGSGRDVAAGVGALIGSEVATQDGELTEGELIGGLLGGIVGNQVGKGSGKTAATAAGVVLGSTLGDNMQNGGNREEVVETRKKVRVCEIEEYPKKIITGYDVVFEHNNYQFSQVLADEPGQYVDISVNVEALEERTSSR